MNGEIYIWNIDKENSPKKYKSENDEYFHREAVTKIIWEKYDNLDMSSELCLITISTDGKVLVWRLKDYLKFPIKGHVLSKTIKGEQIIAGGMCLARVHGYKETTFFAGGENGQIFKVNIKGPSTDDISHYFEN